MMESGFGKVINHAKVIFDTGWYPIYTVSKYLSGIESKI